jgi:cytochrome oxidase Cu insertion factor (SCO1/SenC/PrrC family)
VNVPADARRRSRLGLIGLAALFFVPLALSFWLYYGTDWRPSGGAQHGELIDPARPLPDASLTRADGTPAGIDLLRGNWHLVYVGDGSCGASCRDALVKARQVRLALDKDVNRVSRVFLYLGAAPDPGFLAAEHPDLVAARVDDEAGRPVLAAFPQDPPPASAGHLYIVDPLGNLMMRYPAEAPPRAILSDLERLLRLSHIG